MELSNKSSPLLNVLTRNNVDPFEYNYGGNYGLGHKEQIIVYPLPGPNDIYNKRFVFDIPKNGYLAGANIKITVTSTSDNTDAEDRLGSRVFENIFFETKRGPNIIQRINQLYTNARIDNLSYNLLSHVSSACEPDVDFNNTTVVCWCPLFLYCFENPSQFIYTNFFETLQLTCTTGATKESMGLPYDLTAISCELHLTYVKMYKAPLIKPITVLAYDTFIEPPSVLTSGSTTKTIALTFNKTAYCMHVFAVSSTQEFLRCNRIRIRTGNEVVIDQDRRVNFNQWSSNDYNNISGAFTYWFSINKDRTTNKISQNFHDLNEPSLEVSFETVPTSTFSLYVLFEYWNLLYLTDHGFINRGEAY